MAYVPDLDWVDDAPPGFTAARMRKMQLGIAAASTDAEAAETAARDALQVAESVGAVGVNVKAFGAVGDGVADDSAAINAAIGDGFRTVLIPTGTYRIVAFPIRLQQGTTLQMEAGTTLLNDRDGSEYMIVNGEVGDEAFSTGYDGPGDIRIIGNGATLDCGPRAAKSWGTEAIGITHADTVLIEGLNFRNNYMSHAMEFNSTRHGVVRNCTFAGMNPGASSNREFINIDHSYQGGFPGWGAWDGTPCDDITIENCTFTGGQVAVGTHAGSIPTPHRGIRILNCLIDGMTEHAIRAKSWTGGSMISGCRIIGSQRQALLIEDAADLTVTACHLESNGAAGGAYYPVDVIGTSTRVKVVNNRIARGTIAYENAIRFDIGTSWCEATIAGIDRGLYRYVRNECSLAIIDGTYALTIADDAAAVLPFPGYEQQGIVTVNAHGTGGWAARGTYWARARTGLLAVNQISALAAAQVTLTTGVLTGTTGTDGNVTISAGIDAEGVGNLYLENRSGSLRRFDIGFTAG